MTSGYVHQQSECVINFFLRFSAVSTIFLGAIICSYLQRIFGCVKELELWLCKGARTNLLTDIEQLLLQW